MKRYTKPHVGKPRHNTRDARGVVSCQVFLRGRGSNRMVPGNINRLLSVQSAKVSEIVAVLERALYGTNDR